MANESSTERSDVRPNTSQGGASTRAGLFVLAAAAVLGLCGDILLRVGPPGVNGAVWVAALLAALVALKRRLAPALGDGEAACVAVALAFALALAWRDSAVVKLADLAVVGTMVTLLLLRLLGTRPLGVSMTRLATAGALAGLHAAFGAPVLLGSDVRWREVGRTRGSARALAAVRGTAIAVPIIATFGALLVSADAVFAHILSDVLGINLRTIASHIALAGAFAWIAGGILRAAVLQRPITPFWTGMANPPRLGAVEIGVVLGSLDLLFLSFVLVQVRYLFGGVLYLASLPELTYAEYARRGFFELVGVAALAIPLLLLADWLLRRDAGRGERACRTLAALMALLLFAMMGSALKRMLLYTGTYGLTELRVYTLAFMGWLALVLAWLTLTVLRGRRERFAFGAVAAGVAVVAALNVLNVDGLIARVGLARAANGRFDAAYATSLSADAVPALVEGLGALDPTQREAVVTALARRWRSLWGADWRTWSVARAAATRAFRGETELRDPGPTEAADPPGPAAGR